MAAPLSSTLRQPPVLIDGAHGEGGGQILRTALSLAAITGRPVTFVNIRAGRPKPGLAAQHLTAVRAAGALCAAYISGDALGSLSLEFVPGSPVHHGSYLFDVAEARQGGSAGATSLVLHTALIPLALTAGRSSVTVRGGTHVSSSPSFEYAQDIWLPVLHTMGIAAQLTLLRSGWFPVGMGEIRAEIDGTVHRLRPLAYRDRGDLRRVWGHALAANLPAHITQRMADHATALLAADGIAAVIRISNIHAASAGAALFLGAEYARGRAGITVLGARGKPAEAVAEEAVTGLLACHRSGAAVDARLADQLIVPAALANAPSVFTVERATRHLTTNAWVVEQFGLARVDIAEREQAGAVVTVTPKRA